MQLTEEEILKFQNLFLKRYRIQLTKEDAIERATRLVTLIKSLYLTPEAQKLREEKLKKRLNLKKKIE